MGIINVIIMSKMKIGIGIIMVVGMWCMRMAANWGIVDGRKSGARNGGTRRREGMMSTRIIMLVSVKEVDELPVKGRMVVLVQLQELNLLQDEELHLHRH